LFTTLPDLSSFAGVTHGDDLIYLFPSENIFPGTKLTEKDEQMVDIMTTLWTNFASTG
jgi:carboxylesterase type B